MNKNTVIAIAVCGVAVVAGVAAYANWKQKKTLEAFDAACEDLVDSVDQMFTGDAVSMAEEAYEEASEG